MDFSFELCRWFSCIYFRCGGLDWLNWLGCSDSWRWKKALLLIATDTITISRADLMLIIEQTLNAVQLGYQLLFDILILPK